MSDVDVAAIRARWDELRALLVEMADELANGHWSVVANAARWADALTEQAARTDTPALLDALATRDARIADLEARLVEATHHHRRVPFYESADACPHPEPSDDGPRGGAWDDWLDEHPWSDDCGDRICLAMPAGAQCPSCRDSEYSDPLPWPCPTAVALGLAPADAPPPDGPGPHATENGPVCPPDATEPPPETGATRDSL